MAIATMDTSAVVQFYSQVRYVDSCCGKHVVLSFRWLL